MILAPIAAIVIGLGVLGAVIAWLLLTRGWLHQRKGRKVIIHTTEDQSIEGLILHVTRDGVVLVGARMLGTSDNVPMGGEVFIEKPKVYLVQHLPG